MKSRRFIAAALIAFASLTSCDNSIEKPSASEAGMVKFEVTASSEASATRVELGSDNQVLWQEDDNIGILSKSYYDCLTIASGVGKTTASFSGEVHDTDEDRIAVFPYIDSRNTRYDGDESPYVTLAWEENNIGSTTQVAVKGGFMPSEALMAGRVADDRSVAFKNLLAFVKFRIDFSCSSVTITSNLGEYLASEAVKFRFDDNGVPADISTAPTYAKSTSVTLSGMDGEDLTPGTYYIGVLPQTLEDGFTLSFEMPDGEGKCRKGTSKSVTFKRSGILNLGAITEANMDVFPSGAPFKGEGTAAEPYEIKSKAQLLKLAELLDDTSGYASYASKSYIQKADIDFSGDTLIIGSSSKPFIGTYDGDGCTISNFVAGSKDGLTGLFGAVHNATLKNIVVNPASFNVKWPEDLYAYCGGLAAVATTDENEYVTIDNCHLKSDRALAIALPDDVYLDYGGLIGKSSGNLSMTYCSNQAVLKTIPPTGSHYTNYNLVSLGGLLARADSPDARFLKIDRCWNKGDIEANHVSGTSAGGLVGEIIEPSSFSKDEVTLRMTNCANYGKVTALSANQSANAGGLVANNWADGYQGDDPYVINCLNSGDILATGRPGCAGGLLGKCYDSDTKVYCCVNTGDISGIYSGMPAAIITEYAEYRHLGALCGSDGGYYYYCVWTNNNNELPVVFNSASYSHMVSSAYSNKASASAMNAYRSNIPSGIVSSYCVWTDPTLNYDFDLFITR